ncbi:PepSY domain-containing protein [Streptomyces sp. NBRC 109706]|uniref:PepSY domain-containing protein n=1 Tax=Streptomyces sp. NBRC 109706 TaxID=1550035 RepID=UPI000783AEBC|nr:PepSY domain-containing protein [Streptomyces sp. NBRC 109706]
MKRNMIVAMAAAGAVIAGGTLAGVALGAGGDDKARTESAALSGTSVSLRDGGTAAGAGDDDRDDESADTPLVQDEDSAAQRAVVTALAEAPGVVTEIDLERDDDDPRGWEIEIYGEGERWHRVLVSEDGTEILASREGRSDDDDDDDDLADARSLLAAETSTDALAAVAIAEAHTGAQLREADVDDGRWELELRGEDGTEYEIEISLQSGEIVAQESERDDDDDDDHRDDDRDDDNGRDDDHDDA